ncbi:MAG: bifunctional tetrahydrofolate synthase/dihydrofolate synthase [Candidatus Thiodiazotropha sp. (ex Lucinoma aequizonata)]|nr:bifunctional tetrahydrofolate synthase/dihydrofolate synthase [Candidatus Thiodiazotropha sp. (ex Lucinoma aequizonata)]MCU7889150.1 bifunctional tetrahydrofolate synthase/dihydrofolate synthase [Candidatus Thiodiazotropha sp. (ex Lucinoma aequizonata)]MCU7893875.1 bifunctional tetrahydrofolate synthase/dihydrofolate synthase [Candidatus Thiodiazotropha sp. (ex Lucinoma aequizonata)]MCU7899024.1 bifunctional tetrahydrofolate synthase/dihydrofolate synthase [Candidatus Thiodiazotropha sp. (ex 
MRFDTLDQWLDWQTTLHPKEIELGLDRVIAVWQRLQPEGLHSKVVTIAGTNGKGSSVAILETIYRQADFSVGAYTSPHLVHYNERIRLNGVAVSDQQLCHAFEAIDQARGRVSLTYFEFATLAALIIYAAEKPDLVILEVGLGGRLDAVNIIDTDVALITTIDLDHTDLLGDDSEAIGREKAGIIRSHRPVVLGDREMPRSVSEQAEQLQAEAHLSGREFDFDLHKDGWQWSGPDGVKQLLPVPNLSGSKQLVNASAVVMVCQLLQDAFPLSWELIANGLQQVILPGRLQWVPGKPGLLLDVAHNRQSLETLCEALNRLDCQGHIHALFGMLRDKDVAAVADILGPRITSWYLLNLPGERGRSAKQLAIALRQAGVNKPINCFHAFPQAYQACRDEVHSQDMILVFGSFLIVGEAMGYLDLLT